MPDPAGADAPLIVTLRLDDAAQAHFEALRTQYFPPARLVVGAHVTMFHAIPANCAKLLLAEARIACAELAPFDVAVRGLRFLGRGVAYDLATEDAVRLRGRLAAPIAGHLTRQDSAAWTPHVTVQNKVDPAAARETMAQLQGQDYPARIFAVGLAIWRYLQGPWECLEKLDFSRV